VPQNATASLAVSSSGPSSFHWQHNGADLSDSAHIAGSHSAVLIINHVSTADSGPYSCTVTNSCGTTTSPTATLTVATRCGTADFNCDGNVGTDSDIEAFFSCLSGYCPPAPCPNSADFNGDGAVGTDQDIEAFFRVLSGST
jgi:hypothetical protein